MKTKISPPGLLFFLLSILTGLFLYQNLIEEEYTFYTPAKGEAKYNQYLALEMLLSKLEYNIDSHRHEIIRLPENKNGVVFISDKKIYQNAIHLKNLVSWVNNGGRLIIAGYFPGKNGDDLQLFPGLDIYSAPGTDIKHADDINIDFKYDLDLKHSGTFSSSYDTHWELVDDHGVHAASYKVGNGTIVVFNSLNLFNNYNIANRDHAEFIVSILSKSTVKSFMHIQLPRDRDFADLVRAYPFPFYLLGILLFLSTWFFWGYFGPVKEYMSFKEKLFVAHLQFTGKYLWRHGNIEELYQDLHDQALSKIILKHPDWTTKSDEQKIEIVADKTRLDKEAIYQALFYTTEHNKHKFLTFSRNITLIRDSL